MTPAKYNHVPFPFLPVLVSMSFLAGWSSAHARTCSSTGLNEDLLHTSCMCGFPYLLVVLHTGKRNSLNDTGHTALKAELSCLSTLLECEMSQDEKFAFMKQQTRGVCRNIARWPKTPVRLLLLPREVYV